MTKPLIYLDNAATTYPKPGSVPRRVAEVIADLGGNPGRGAHRMSLDASRVVFGTREALAGLLNIKDASRIAFTKNATEAINIALKGLLKAGDHVVTTGFEHNSVVRTLARLTRDVNVRVTKVIGKERADFVSAADVEAAITKDTKLVAITHASNVVGTIQPVYEIAELCRAKGVLFMVDAAQTIGALPVDLGELGADIVVGTGHKALFGPQGTGFVYFKEGVEPEPLIDGGTGEEGVYLEMPDRFESGTVNTPGIGGLGAGIEFVLNEGVEKIRARESALTSMLLTGLSEIEGVTIFGPMDVESRVALVSFTIEGLPPVDVGRRLDEDFLIMARCGTHCAPDAHRTIGTHPLGTNRISPGYFTTDADIEVLLKAVKTMAGGG